MYKGSNFSRFSPTLLFSGLFFFFLRGWGGVVLFCFDGNHPDGCEVVSHCGFEVTKSLLPLVLVQDLQEVGAKVGLDMEGFY